ncbi:hypothetical protein M407DRAFT_229169 [Tulasnella calospora MUT 4182]|uniref:Protein kinase domain-containing protein n=1 Tax=Tulasnella calospora MUT 4182 TaxID=1051891 RepID=A0A0C3M5J2_9AGAM|nr:hypothetical protein M407DRAFT_229169 [Tulasnella calospora MUT 4182]
MRLNLSCENGEVPRIPLSGRIVKRTDIVHYGELTDLAQGDFTFDNRTTQSVAIKRLRCVGGRQRYDEELLEQHLKASIIMEHFPKWIQLRHKNLNPVIDFQISSEPLIINPWIKNNLSRVIYGSEGNYALMDLKARLDKWSVIKDICDGFEYLHTQSPRPIVHGGLGMTTVLIDENNGTICAKLSNFGLEPILRRISFDTVLTSMNDPHEYTPAPEVLSGPPPAYEEAIGEAPPGMEDDEDVVAPSGMTPASDIYDIGTWMLEVLSEKTPWLKLSRARAVIATMRGERPSPADHPGIPATHAAWTLIGRCWAQNAKERPCIREISDTVDVIRSQRFSTTIFSEKAGSWDSPARL